MRLSTLSLAIALYCLCGCNARTPPIQAAWYIVPENAASSNFSAAHTTCASSEANEGRSGTDRQLYLALLNQSQTTISDIDEIVLNEDKNNHNSAWKLEVSCKLEPGQIVMLPLKKFHRDGQTMPDCYVPVTVAIHQRGAELPIMADVSGGLPNAIPLEWQTRCGVHPA